MAYARSLYDSEKKKIIKASDLKKDIPPDAVAMAVMANIRNGITDPEENGTNVLISMVQEDDRGLYWESSNQIGHFASVEKSTALAVRALLSPRVVTGSSLDAAEKGIAYLQDSRTRQYWRNTYATAQIIQVFTDYANKKTEEPSDVSYVVTLNDKEFEKGVLSSEDNDYIEIPLPRTQLSLSDDTQVTVRTDNNANQLRSVLTVRDSISDVEYKGKDAGIKIKRYYTTESGWKEKDTIHVGDLVVVHLDLDLHKNTTGQAVIADTLPAGLIPVNTKLDNENEKVSKYGLFDRYMEYLPDGVIIPIDNLTKGKHSYYYYARAITEGTYQTPPAQTEMMYQPEIYGHTESARVSVYASQVDQESQSSSGNTNIDPTIQHLQEVNDEQEEARNTLEDDISELSEENKDLKEQIGLVQTMQYGLLALVIGLPVGVGAYIHRKKIVRYGKKGLKKVKPLWSKLKSIFERIGKRG
jgi:hypothetical protein